MVQVERHDGSLRTPPFPKVVLILAAALLRSVSTRPIFGIGVVFALSVSETRSSKNFQRRQSDVPHGNDAGNELLDNSVKVPMFVGMEVVDGACDPVNSSWWFIKYTTQEGYTYLAFLPVISTSHGNRWNLQLYEVGWHNSVLVKGATIPSPQCLIQSSRLVRVFGRIRVRP